MSKGEKKQEGTAAIFTGHFHTTSTSKMFMDRASRRLEA
jgi:hypothetical protein